MRRRAEDVFRFAPDVPADLLPALRRVLWPLACMVPGWCHHVNVYFHLRGDDDCNASVSSQFDYRWVTVYVHPCWLEADERTRRENLAHELAHAVLAPLADWTRDVIKRLVPKDEAEKFHSVLMEGQRERVEMVTQDLAYLFLGDKAERENHDGKRNRQPPRRRRR